jgi:hypothetical protein
VATCKARQARRRFATPVALFLLVALGATFANAGLSDPVLTVYAESGDGTSSPLIIPYDAACWDAGSKTYAWSLSSPVDLLSGSTFIGRLQAASLLIDAGAAPEITLTLDVLAGAAWTDFHADTALLSFPTPIASDEAAARLIGSGEVWDLSAPANEVWMVGLTPNYGAFEACYNGNPPAASVFAEVLGVIGMPSGGSGHATGGESQPGVGYAPLNVPVDDMCLCAAFQLSPNDRALTTGVYGLESSVPEPTALALLAIGVAMIGRRGRG